MGIKTEVTVTQMKARSFSESTMAENRTLISRFYSLAKSVICENRIVKSTLLTVETENH